MAAATAVTIGNFDGVHLGHVELIQRARAAAGKGGKVVVLSFDPHPLSVLRPDAVPAQLSTMQQRIDWCVAAGADEVMPLQPTPDVLRQSPEEFIGFLVRNLSPSFIVEGADFRFGRGRSGSIQTLQSLEPQFGYRTIVVDAVEVCLSDQSMVRAGSSLVRWLLERGRVHDAACVLGRPYELRSEVVRGDQRGRTIGVPTANLPPSTLLLPADGIYAGCATGPDGSSYPAAISVGTKPTFGVHPRVCEVHLINFNGRTDEYGWPIRVQFTHWLRDQLTFDSIEPLVRQLERDIARALECSTQTNQDMRCQRPQFPVAATPAIASTR